MLIRLARYYPSVPRPDFPRTIIEFQHRFPDDAACREYLAASRWPDGYRCPRCGYDQAVGLKQRLLWQCSACRYQVSVTAGTVLHATRTPLAVWFWAAYLVTTATPGISALQLQRQLGITQYETAWMVLHKLRRAMVAPEREPLTREVEVDECFVGGYEAGLRGGRAHGTKALVVAVEVRGPESGRVRLRVVPNASATPGSTRLALGDPQGMLVHLGMVQGGVPWQTVSLTAWSSSMGPGRHTRGQFG